MEILLEEIRSNVKLALEGQDVLRSEMKQMEQRLSEGIQGNSLKIGILSKKLDAVHSSLKNEIKITAMAINDKLDEHIRLPSHA